MAARVGLARLEPGLVAERDGPSLGERLAGRWLRLDDVLLVWDDALDGARAAGLEVAEAEGEPAPADLRLVLQVGRTFEREHPDVPVVLSKGRFLVVALDADDAQERRASHDACWVLRPLPAAETIFRRVGASPREPAPGVTALVEAVDPLRLGADLARLAGHPTRHSLSPGFDEASAWAAGELERLGLAVAFEEVAVNGGVSRNVVAERPGAAPGTRGLVVVCAHLDSINQGGGPAAPAPGADDNGSGVAALLEIARVLAPHPAGHDLRLICFGGEEQGLHGSRIHVRALAAEDRDRVRAVINMDMVATRNTETRTVLLEGAPVSQALLDELAAAAATHTRLEVQTSLSPFASDHVPFIEAGMPAALTIEGADRANGNVHTAEDILEHIDLELATEIVRMNVAAAAAALGPVQPEG